MKKLANQNIEEEVQIKLLFQNMQMIMTIHQTEKEET